MTDTLYHLPHERMCTLYLLKAQTTRTATKYYYKEVYRTTSVVCSSSSSSESALLLLKFLPGGIIIVFMLNNQIQNICVCWCFFSTPWFCFSPEWDVLMTQKRERPALFYVTKRVSALKSSRIQFDLRRAEVFYLFCMCSLNREISKTASPSPRDVGVIRVATEEFVSILYR